jgi:DNA polymerase I-like protein with 3'-5' exonuclease and polymerase domains
MENEDLYEDTLLMAAIEDASRKEKGLKFLTENLLGREMIEINELGIQGSKKDIVAFDMVPPQKAVYYGASDAMCTYALYEHLKSKIDEQDPTGKSGPWAIYKIEKRCLFVTMEMERNLVKIDRPYIEKCKVDVIGRIQKSLKGIYAIAGREFDVNSPKQLGILLFEELKIPYPVKEKTATNQYITNEKVLEKLSGKYPIVDLILTYRGFVKILETYIENFLRNADENDEVKFQLNQVRADTGRFSSTGGQGLLADGYSGVNCQNLPNFDPDNPDSIDLRRAVIARPGCKIASIDYSGEELRIAANFSKEPLWIKEFLEGTGDLHSITGRIIHKKQDISKKERGVGKTLNFLTLYGGGAGGFATKAKIPYETAKKMIINFFEEYKGIKSWIDRESKAARKRGYSKTAFGRRRPLTQFYSSPDKKDQAFADRCAINSAIQGCLQDHERVLTNMGYLQIKNVNALLEKSALIKVWTGTEWANFSVIDKGNAQLARIELSNGLYIDCDTRHEVLVVGSAGYKFRKYSELTQNDQICVSVPTPKVFGKYPSIKEFTGGLAHNSVDVVIKDNTSWDFVAYLLGYTIGDGSVRFNNRESVTISFGKDKLDNNAFFLEQGLKTLGLNPQKSRRSKGSKGESYQMEISSKALVSIFEYLGYTFSGALNKRVPEMIFAMPYEMRLYFMKGIFDTDCCKKPINRYSFHTPNRELLHDIQILAWSIGLTSCICETNANTFRLDWSDLRTFEEMMGMPVVSCKKRRTACKMILPDFMYEDINNILQKYSPLRNGNDRALLSKIKLKKPVTIPTVIRLLRDYGAEIPTIYYHYPFKRKTSIDKVAHTYTLSVNNPGHRFDSACIISKNTGADVIKIALYRIWKWIHTSGLEDDIRILAPVHDEVVFEIKEDKLDALIPEMCRIMRLEDVTTKLQWQVPLDVDAEYGDSFHVDHDFWKEHKKKQAEMVKAVPTEIPGPVAETQVLEVHKDMPSEVSSKTISHDADHGDAPQGKEEEYIPEAKKKDDSNVEVTVSKDMPTASTSSDATQYYINITVKNAFAEGVEKKEDIKEVLKRAEDNKQLSPVFNDAHVKDRIDEKGFFNYPMDVDSVTARKLRFIFEMLLVSGDSVFIGPKYKVCLLSKEGEVYYRSSEPVSVDAFIALCLTFTS